MNWFAIGAGFAMIVVAIAGAAQNGGRISRPAAIVLGLVGILFLYLGGVMELTR